MKNVLRMAKIYHTSVFDWLSIPLIAFCSWIRAGNAVINEDNEQLEEIRKAKKK